MGVGAAAAASLSRQKSPSRPGLATTPGVSDSAGTRLRVGRGGGESARSGSCAAWGTRPSLRSIRVAEERRRGARLAQRDSF